MPAKALDTSITTAAASSFLASADERATLFCQKIPGFYLMKLKRGGAWRYRYTDPTGKRRVATIGGYPAMKPQQAAESAQAWRNAKADPLKEKKTQRADAIEADKLAEKRKLETYLRKTYTPHQDRKKGGNKTLAMIRHSFADWLDRDMATLTRADVRAWQADREAEGLAHGTLQRSLGALKTMLRHATRQDPPVLPANPLEGVRLERPTDRARADELSADKAIARRLLTPDEIQSLHTGLDGFADERRCQRRNSRLHGKPHLPDLDSVAYPHWAIPFTLMALYTGLRPGDLYSLTWTELNINFGRLVKIPEKTRHHPDPARIVMTLPPDLMLIVRAWWDQRGKPESGLVFPSPETKGQLDNQAHRRAWVRIKKLGGLPAELAFYALRHNFISTLVANGVPLLTVAQMSGHKSASMIERHYGHLCPMVAADALAQFSKTVATQSKPAKSS